MGEVRHVLRQGAGGGGRAARTPAGRGEGWGGGDTIGGGGGGGRRTRNRDHIFLILGNAGFISSTVGFRVSGCRLEG